MEIFMDNCVVSELLLTKGYVDRYGVSEKDYRGACSGIINGITSFGNTVNCSPTLFHEFNNGSGSEKNWLHPDFKYTAKCDPSKIIKSKADFESVHFENFDIFSESLVAIESYLGVDFDSQSHEKIADLIFKRFKIPKSHSYEIFKAQGESGRAKIAAQPVRFNGELVINKDFRVFDLVQQYSQSEGVQAFFTYVLASIYLRFKGDAVFPFKTKNKKRDRRSSLINDFLYIYFAIGRECMFISSDRALVFKASATLRMLRKEKVMVLELDAKRYISLQAKLMARQARKKNVIAGD